MKILIVKTSALGDIIHAFPVLQYLRACYPEAQIDWVVEKNFAPLIEAHPSLSQAIKIDTKKWRKSFWKKEIREELNCLCLQLRHTHYDLLFDLQSNLKSSLINFLARSAKKIGFGRKTVHEWPNLFSTNWHIDPPANKNIRDDYLYLAQYVVGNFDYRNQGVKLRIDQTEILKIKQILHNANFKNGPKILVCAGSNWPNKQLGSSTLLSFLKSIATQLNGQFLFVWGTDEERKIVEKLSIELPNESYIVEKMGLASLQNLMAEVDLVMAMDSLPLHLAATTSTPTYSIFGASSAKKFKPVGTFHESYQGQCPYGRTFVKRCPILRTCKTGACIKNIQGEELYNHFSNWWQQIKSEF